MKWEKGQRDLDLLEKVATTSLDKLAQDLCITKGALHLRIYGIRKRLERYQWYVNNIYNLQKRSKRVRKFTISAELPQEETEEKLTLDSEEII